VPYVAGVGVVDLGMAVIEGGGVEMESVGTVERIPEVVYGVRSSTSGKISLIGFFDA
jgi:hypothetical protein